MTELTHAGVKGMKWGVRKDRDSGSKARRSKKEDLSKLSDQQLRDRINRLNMEKQYSQMTAGPSRKGQAIVGKLLGDIGKEIAKEMIKNAVKKGIKTAVSR